MLIGVEQAVEVEARGPLVLGLQDSLGVVQADPPDVLGELSVGSHQILCGGAQPTVCRVNLLDERVVGHRRLPSPPPVSLPSIRTPHRSRFTPQPGNTTVVTPNSEG